MREANEKWPTATPAVVMDGASEELERRSQYLSSLIQRTKLKTGDGGGVSDGEEKRSRNELVVVVPVLDKHRLEKPPRRHEPAQQLRRPSQSAVQKQKQVEKAEEEEEEAENVRVRASDMPLALQKRAIRCAREALAAMPKLDSKRLALALKKEFDLSYGPAWHCIVGTSFGSYVTHSLGGFLYFSIDKVYILLFRTAVEPLSR